MQVTAELKVLAQGPNQGSVLRMELLAELPQLPQLTCTDSVHSRSEVNSVAEVVDFIVNSAIFTGHTEDFF